jgi:hypothetical protein
VGYLMQRLLLGGWPAVDLRQASSRSGSRRADLLLMRFGGVIYRSRCHP